MKHTYQPHLVRTSTPSSKLPHTPVLQSVTQRISTPQSYTKTKIENESESFLDGKRSKHQSERKNNQHQNMNKIGILIQNQNRIQENGNERILSSQQDNEQNVPHTNNQLELLGEGSSMHTNQRYFPEILNPRFLTSENDGGKSLVMKKKKGQYSETINSENPSFTINSFPNKYASFSITEKNHFSDTNSNVNGDINTNSYNNSNFYSDTNIMDETNIHEYYSNHEYFQYRSKNENENEEKDKNENENENEKHSYSYNSHSHSNSMPRQTSDDITLSDLNNYKQNHEYHTMKNQNIPHTYWTTPEINHDCTYKTNDTSNNQFYPYLYTQSEAQNDSSRKTFSSISDDNNLLRINSDFLNSSSKQYQEKNFMEKIDIEVQDLYQPLYQTEEFDVNDTESR